MVKLIGWLTFLAFLTAFVPGIAGAEVLVPLQSFLTFVGNTTAMYATYRIAVSNRWSAPWGSEVPSLDDGDGDRSDEKGGMGRQEDSGSLVGFEDLGDALAEDNDYSFILKLFAGCAVAR